VWRLHKNVFVISEFLR